MACPFAGLSNYKRLTKAACSVSRSALPCTLRSLKPSRLFCRTACIRSFAVSEFAAGLSSGRPMWEATRASSTAWRLRLTCRTTASRLLRADGGTSQPDFLLGGRKGAGAWMLAMRSMADMASAGRLAGGMHSAASRLCACRPRFQGRSAVVSLRTTAFEAPPSATSVSSKLFAVWVA